MNPNFYDQDDPILSREDAIAILDTPDEKLDDLIARAEGLRRKYKGNRVSIHILTNARSGNCSQDCAYCVNNSLIICPMSTETVFLTIMCMLFVWMMTIYGLVPIREESMC